MNFFTFLKQFLTKAGKKSVKANNSISSGKRLKRNASPRSVKIPSQPVIKHNISNPSPSNKKTASHNNVTRLKFIDPTFSQNSVTSNNLEKDFTISNKANSNIQDNMNVHKEQVFKYIEELPEFSQVYSQQSSTDLPGEKEKAVRESFSENYRGQPEMANQESDPVLAGENQVLLVESGSLLYSLSPGCPDVSFIHVSDQVQESTRSACPDVIPQNSLMKCLCLNQSTANFISSGFLENKTIRSHNLMDRARWRENRKYIKHLLLFPSIQKFVLEQGQWFPVFHPCNGVEINGQSTWTDQPKSIVFLEGNLPDVIYLGWRPFGFLENQIRRNHHLMNRNLWQESRRYLKFLLFVPTVERFVLEQGQWFPIFRLCNKQSIDSFCYDPKLSASENLYKKVLPEVIYLGWKPFGLLSNQIHRSHFPLIWKKWRENRYMLYLLIKFCTPILIMIKEDGLFPIYDFNQAASLGLCEVTEGSEKICSTPDVISLGWNPIGFLENKICRNHSVLSRKAWLNNKRRLLKIFLFPNPPKVIFTSGPVDTALDKSLLVVERKANKENSISIKPIAFNNFSGTNNEVSEAMKLTSVEALSTFDSDSDSNISVENSSFIDQELEEIQTLTVKEPILINNLEDQLDYSRTQLSSDTTAQKAPYLSECYDPKLMLPSNNNGESDSDDPLAKVFKNSPLIGLADLPEDQINEILHKARRYLACIHEKSLTPNPKINRTITYAIIELAKDWDPRDESYFWIWILKHLDPLDQKTGYTPNQVNRFNPIIKFALKESMECNNRLIIRSTKNTQFKNTVLVHSMGQKDLWFEAFTFLFEYLVLESNGEYTGSDQDKESLIDLMFGLQEIINKTGDDNAIDIFTKQFKFPIGLRILIVLQPDYVLDRFDRYLFKIQSMFFHTEFEEELSTREQQILEEWYRLFSAQLQVSEFPTRKRREDNASSKSLSQVRVSYALSDERGMILEVGDIKSSSPFEDPKLLLIVDGKKRMELPLNWYWNQGSPILEGKSIPLNTVLSVGFIEFLRVEIWDQNQCLYSSGKLLNRSCWFFKENKEVKVSETLPNAVILVAHHSASIQESVLSHEEIDLLLPDGYIARMYHTDQNSSLIINQIHFGQSNPQHSNSLRVLFPRKNQNMPVYLANGVRYRTYIAKDQLIILTDRPNPERTLRIFINDKEFFLQKTQFLSSGKVKLLIPLKEGPNSLCSIKIVDFTKGCPIFEEICFVLKGLEFSFDKSYYFSEDDCITGSLRARLNGKWFTATIPFGENYVKLPIKGNHLDFQIPRVSLSSLDQNWIWMHPEEVYIDDLQEGTILKITKPNHVKASIVLNNLREYSFHKDLLNIGNIIRSSKDDWKDCNSISCSLKLQVLSSENPQEIRSEKMYAIGKVSLKPHFNGSPSFVYQDRKIQWRGNHEYIGPKPKKLSLTLEKEDHVINLSFSMDAEWIDLPEETPYGVYSYKFYTETGKLFHKTKEQCGSGQIAIGDPNVVRFMGKQIHLLRLESSECKSKILRTERWYIDNLKYIGVHIANEEDGELHFYEGSLYIKQNNQKIYMSDHSGTENGKELAVINPVRLGVIDHSRITMTSCDEEGLYIMAKNDGKNGGTFFKYEPDYSASLMMLDYASYEVVD